MLLTFVEVENDEAAGALLLAVYLILDDGILLPALSVRWSVVRTEVEDMAG